MTCLALAALAATTGHLRAEVAAEPGPLKVAVLVVGIIEGPDPIPQSIWDPVRDIDPELVLNSDGGQRGDGRPDIAMDPVTKWPHVVWAYGNGTDYDIAYSRWDGDGWLETEFVTSTTANEIDPRIHVDRDYVYVVWWVEETGSIWLVRRPRLGAWQMSERVNGQQGMRPSVVTWNGTVLVASETDDGQGGMEILMSTRLGAGSFFTEFIGSTAEHLALDVVLHTGQGKLWMDWKHSDTEFAYSEFVNDAWGPITTLPWTDPSWIGVEEMRLRVRGRVLATP
jgi:hypothetical protein